MDFLPLGDVELHYTSLEFLDYGVGGQHYGTLDGWLRGEDVRGELRLTNLAPRRPDNVNLPTLRGLLTTEDDALVYVEMNGSPRFVRPMTPGCLSLRSRSARAMRAMAGSTPSSVFLRAYWTRSR
jgi:hypothetical protein